MLEEQLETHRLAKLLEQLTQLQIVWQDTDRPGPLAFPLLVERLGTRMTNESLLERIERLKQQWGKK